MTLYDWGNEGAYCACAMQVSMVLIHSEFKASYTYVIHDALV